MPIPLPNPEPMAGQGARKRKQAKTQTRTRTQAKTRPSEQDVSTGRPNRNRPTTSLAPAAPSTPEAIEAAREHGARQKQRIAWGGHDGLCLVTYAAAHTLEIATGKGEDREVHTLMAPTPEQTLVNCHCTCARCWDRAISRCVCRLCPCVRPEMSVPPIGSRTNQYLPQAGFA